jgi:hypothetical protein
VLKLVGPKQKDAKKRHRNRDTQKREHVEGAVAGSQPALSEPAACDDAAEPADDR